MTRLAVKPQIDVDSVLEDFQKEALTMAAIWRNKTRDPSIFDTAFSYAMEGAWKAAKTYDPSSGTSLKTWMKFKASKEILDGFRKLNGRKIDSKKRENGKIPLDLLRVEPLGSSDEDRIISKLTVAKLLRMVEGRLGTTEKRCLLMRYREGFLLQEIADILGCNESNVSQAVKRAVLKLRRSYGTDRT